MAKPDKDKYDTRDKKQHNLQQLIKHPCPVLATLYELIVAKIKLVVVVSVVHAWPHLAILRPFLFGRSKGVPGLIYFTGTQLVAARFHACSTCVDTFRVDNHKG